MTDEERTAIKETWKKEALLDGKVLYISPDGVWAYQEGDLGEGRYADTFMNLKSIQKVEETHVAKV